LLTLKPEGFTLRLRRRQPTTGRQVALRTRREMEAGTP
jgi:hypothetical protein